MFVLEFQRGFGFADEASDPGVDDRTDRVGVLVIAREGLAAAKDSKREVVNVLGVVLVASGRLEYRRLAGRAVLELEALG